MDALPPHELRPESGSGTDAPGAGVSASGAQAGGQPDGLSPAMSPAPIPMTLSAPAPSPFSQTTSLASTPAVPIDPAGRSRPIGEVLLSAGLLTLEQVDQVLDHAAQKRPQSEADAEGRADDDADRQVDDVTAREEVLELGNHSHVGLRRPRH